MLNEEYDLETSIKEVFKTLSMVSAIICTHCPDFLHCPIAGHVKDIDAIKNNIDTQETLLDARTKILFVLHAENADVRGRVGETENAMMDDEFEILKDIVISGFFR